MCVCKSSTPFGITGDLCCERIGRKSELEVDFSLWDQINVTRSLNPTEQMLKSYIKDFFFGVCRWGDVVCGA